VSTPGSESIEEAIVRLETKVQEVADLTQRITNHEALPTSHLANLKHIVKMLIDSRELIEKHVRNQEAILTILSGHSQFAVPAKQAVLPSPDDVAMINAAYWRQMNIAPILEALQREQEAAERIARSLVAEQPELQKLPEAQSPAVLRSLEILSRQLKDRDAVLEWLNKQQADLGGQTAMDFMRAGRADVVEQMLSDALSGTPS